MEQNYSPLDLFLCLLKKIMMFLTPLIYQQITLRYPISMRKAYPMSWLVNENHCIYMFFEEVYDLANCDIGDKEQVPPGLGTIKKFLQEEGKTEKGIIGVVLINFN